MPADPFEMVAPPLVGPSGETYFGSDYLGRDVFIGIIHGARPTMIIALTATLVHGINWVNYWGGCRILWGQLD